MHLLTSKVFDAETYTTKLYGIELVYLVIKLSLGILERPDNQPKPVYGFFLSLRVAMLHIEPI